MPSDNRYLKREKGEATTSRYVQFKVPTPSFTPSKNQTDFSRTSLKWVNDNIDEVSLYHPPQSFELVVSKMSDFIKSNCSGDIAANPKPNSKYSAKGGCSSQPKPQDLKHLLLNKLKRGEEVDVCSFFSDINQVKQIIQDAALELQQKKISLMDYNLLIKFLNKALKVSCL